MLNLGFARNAASMPCLYFILIHLFILINTNGFLPNEISIINRNFNVSTLYIEGTSKEENEWRPIRIHMDYSLLENNTNLNEKQITAIKNIAEQSVEMMTNLVNVKPLRENIQFSSCGLYKFPNNSHIEADLVIILDYDNNSNTESYSFSCKFDPVIGRPTVGMIHFTKTFYLKDNWLEYYTYIFFHELTHIMIFNDFLWKKFIDDNGKRIPYEKVLKTTIDKNFKIIKKIITPKVIQKARLHFDCNTLDGVELEDKGELGSVGMHWKARYMLTDYMVSNIYIDNTISEITLAFFEDSGWYKVNYYTGGLFRFGKHKGCEFLNSKCIKNKKSLFTNEFCDDVTKPTCSNTRTSKGYCNIRIQSNIKKKFKYFSNNEVGYQYTDYCPVSTTPNSLIMHMPSNCMTGNTNHYPQELEEHVSNDSACFISSLINEKHSFILKNYRDKNKSICYRFKCNYDKRILIVFIGKSSVECPLEGGIVKIRGYSGVLYCPDFNQICTNTKKCLTMIDCALYKVTAYNDTYKYDYEISNFEITGKSVLIKDIEELDDYIFSKFCISKLGISLFIWFFVSILICIRVYIG